MTADRSSVVQTLEVRLWFAASEHMKVCLYVLILCCEAWRKNDKLGDLRPYCVGT